MLAVRMSSTMRTSGTTSPAALFFCGCLGFGLFLGCAEEPAGGGEKPVIGYLQGPQIGRWHKPRTNRFDPNLSEAARQEIAGLESLGYLEGVHAAGELSGVTRHEPIQPGLSFYTPAHEATAILMTNAGEALHTWSYRFKDAWPNYPHQNKLATFWRRTHLFPNGDLIGIYEGLGIVKIDKDSNLIWKSNVRAHHDLEVLEDGRILVLSREAHILPRIHAERPVLEDFISILGPGGKELQRFSLFEALEGTEFDQDWSERMLTNRDLQHTNSLELLDGSLASVNPAFARGNWLVSMLLLDLVCVIDAQTKKAIWGQFGPHKLQHDPQVLDNGRVLVFDNQGARLHEDPAGGASRIIELDPVRWEVLWSYEGPANDPFYSQTCGLAQRLENGNTLITESDYGRAFEVTPDGKTVWEFINPHRAGEEGQFIATLMEVVRLPEDFGAAWLQR